MQTLSTTDYGMFSFIASNREINTANMGKIVASIKYKNLMHLNPIIVDEKFRVIDGQHRLEACKQLGIPVFYVVSEGISNVDISLLNASRKNWVLQDYLNFYCTEGHETYKKLSRFMNSHQRIPLVQAMKLLAPNTSQNDFKVGAFYIADYSFAETMANRLEQLSEYGKHVFSGGFIKAFSAMCDTENFEYEKFEHQLKKAPRSFVPCVNTKQYLEMFEEIYNRDVKKQYRLSFN